MDNIEKLKNIIAKQNGMITTAQVTAENIHRLYLKKLVDSGYLVKVERGVYCRPEVWEDEMYILQYKYSKGIFSHETALYIHGFTDRTPISYSMTFPYGYNNKALSDENIKVKMAVENIYTIGLSEGKSPCGNKIKIYDLERTLCDIVRGNNSCDIQIVNDAMRRYAAYKEKDISKLMMYAEKLRVKNKIANYMEVLL